MSENNDGKISVYVANLGKYNEGQLVGGWVNLPLPQAELDLFLRETVGVELDPEVAYVKSLQGERVYEEYAIHDYEYDDGLEAIGYTPGEYENLFDLNILAQTISDLSEDELNAVRFMANQGSCRSALEYANLALQADDIPFFSWPDDLNYSSGQERLAYAEIEAAGGVENLSEETLREHFNYESYGRTLDHKGYTIGDYGYLDSSIGDIDTDYYNEEELIDEAESRGFGGDHTPSREEMSADFEAVGFTYLDNFNDYNLRIWQAVHYLIDDLTFEQGCALELYSDHMSPIPSPIEIGNAALQVDDIAYHEWPDNGIYSNDHERLAYAEIDSLGGLDELNKETLEQYFDFESYGQALDQYYYVDDSGYMAADAPTLYTDYYDREDLIAEIESDHPDFFKPLSDVENNHNASTMSLSDRALSAKQVSAGLDNDDCMDEHNHDIEER